MLPSMNFMVAVHLKNSLIDHLFYLADLMLNP